MLPALTDPVMAAVVMVAAVACSFFLARWHRRHLRETAAPPPPPPPWKRECDDAMARAYYLRRQMGAGGWSSEAIATLVQASYFAELAHENLQEQK